MNYLRIRNFSKYQHYKDRRPIWIKLYRELWSDPDFFVLTETERYFLISFFSVASQNDNKIPEDQRWLKREMATKKRVPIERLIATRWLEQIPTTTVAASTASSIAVCESDSTVAINAINIGASSDAISRARARSREQEQEQEQEIQEEKPSVPLCISKTEQAAVPEVVSDERTSERTNGIKPSENFQKYWGPVEGFLRKQIIGDQFDLYFSGVRVVEMTSLGVTLAVPEAMIERYRGADIAALWLGRMIKQSGTNFLRDRELQLVPLNGSAMES